jgi:signal peptidase I
MVSVKDIKDYDGKKREYKYTISFVVTVLVLYALFHIFFNVSEVSGSSMYPTLKDGDITISLKTKFCTVKQGDIVNIKSEQLEEGIVKRIVGVAGDTINISETTVYLNGAVESTGDYSESKGLSVTVPNGSVFVMGDNRGESLDSRKLGTLSEAEIYSKVLLIIN